METDALLASASDYTELPASLRALAARGVARNYRRGTLLIEEGSQGDAIYLVLSGSLAGQLHLGWMLSACAGAHLLALLGARLSAIYRVA